MKTLNCDITTLSAVLGETYSPDDDRCPFCGTVLTDGTSLVTHVGSNPDCEVAFSIWWEELRAEATVGGHS